MADLACAALNRTRPTDGQVLGIGVPGSVDATRRINTRSILTGWRDVPFAGIFEEALGLPVVIEHNATAVAMAEATYGAGRDAESILYLLLGKGIGGGYAQTGIDERRSPVEIGHIAVAPGGPLCRCGSHGCLERFFSEEPLIAAVGTTPFLPADLVAAAMQTRAWPVIHEYLLQALSTTVTLLGPQRVGLGGDLNAAPDALLDALRHDLPARVMPQQRQRLTIERTSLAEPTGVHGAACVALEHFFYSGKSAAHHRAAKFVAQAARPHEEDAD